MKDPNFTNDKLIKYKYTDIREFVEQLESNPNFAQESRANMIDSDILSEMEPMSQNGKFNGSNQISTNQVTSSAQNED